MAVAVREVDPRTSLAAPAIGRRRSERSERSLRVDGALPPGLDGTFVRAHPHPARTVGSGRAAAACAPLVLSGIHLADGTAQWFRSKTEVRRGTPLMPVPALAPSVWLTGPGEQTPDGPGQATIARPVRDESSGRWHTIASYPDLGYAEHLIADPDGAVADAEPFPLDGGPLMSALALTRRYVVVFDLPVAYSPAVAMIGARLPYAWRPDRPARIGLLPRSAHGLSVEPRWFPVDPCYISHVVNAYDDRDQVVLDAVSHARAFDGSPRAAHQTAAEPPCLRRWTFHLTSGSVSGRPLMGSQESAVVDERVSGRRHRYMFGVAAGGTALVRHDLAAESTQVRTFGSGRRAGHPVFVPREGVPRQTDEGDGWIVVLVQDVARGRGELMVLDALDPTGSPRAVVHVPTVAPPAQRVTWLTSAERP